MGFLVVALTVNEPKNPVKSHPFVGLSDLCSRRDHTLVAVFHSSIPVLPFFANFVLSGNFVVWRFGVGFAHNVSANDTKEKLPIAVVC